MEEMTLGDALKVFWRRKWLILLPAFCIALVVGLISSFSAPKWDVDAVIHPSMLPTQDMDDSPRLRVSRDLMALAGKINLEFYNRRIADDLNLDIRELPRLKAETFRHTPLIRVLLRTEDPDTGAAVLHSLFSHLKVEADEKVEIETAGFDAEIAIFGHRIAALSGEIESHEHEVAWLQAEIDRLENRKARIAPIRLVKEPAPSAKPVFPRTDINIAVAAMASLFVFSIVAFLVENPSGRKDRRENRKEKTS